MSTIYIVHMCRWGSNENHSYISGAYMSLKEALAEGLYHSVYRGNKYEPEICSVIPGDGRPRVLCDSIDSAQELYKQITGDYWKKQEEEE